MLHSFLFSDFQLLMFCKGLGFEIWCLMWMFSETLSRSHVYINEVSTSTFNPRCAFRAWHESSLIRRWGRLETRFQDTRYNLSTYSLSSFHRWRNVQILLVFSEAHHRTMNLVWEVYYSTLITIQDNVCKLLVMTAIIFRPWTNHFRASLIIIPYFTNWRSFSGLSLRMKFRHAINGLTTACESNKHMPISTEVWYTRDMTEFD